MNPRLRTASPELSETLASGTAGDDALQGTAGDDTLRGGAGDDTLEGSGGRNTAVFSGNSADYRFGRTIDGWISVTDLNRADGNDGTDLLHNIEALQFADRTMTGLLGGEMLVSPESDYHLGGGLAVALAGGGSMVVWFVGAAVSAQRYDAAGRAQGEVLELGIGNSPYMYALQAIRSDDGGFAVFWQEYDQTTLSYLQRFSADGTALGGPALLHEGVRPEARVAPLGDDTVLMTWIGDVGVCMQRVRVDGTALGEPQVVAEESPDLGGYAAAAVLADGSFVITWQAAQGQGENYELRTIRAQRYDADGTPRGGPILVTPPDQGAVLYTQPAVCALADGGFAMAWTGSPAAPYYLTLDLYTRSYDADGTPRGDAVMVNQWDLAYESVALTPLEDGGYLVSWRGMGDGTFFQPMLRPFDADGVPQGDVLLLQTTGDFWGTEGMDLEPLADGKFIATWVSHTADDERVVRMQLLDAQGHPIAQVLGGSGGADRFDLGADGSLNAAGGAGDDVYIVNETGDRAIERAGEGTDSVRSSIGWTLGAELENLQLRGSAAIDGTGNALANLIEGNEAANRIDGGKGNDTLLGGGGVDTLSYASATARVNVAIGVAGAQDTGGAGIDVVAGFENLAGSRFADRLGGDKRANVIAGDLGNDTLVGGGGDDTLDGGAGSNTAAYSGSSAGYRLGWEIDGRLRVTDIDPSDGDEGSDLLRDVHALQFADGRLGVGAEGGLRLLVYRDQAELQLDQRVAVLPDGSYIVSWVQAEHIYAKPGVWLQRFGADGVALGDAMRAHDADDGLHYHVDIEPLAGGGFVLGWVSETVKLRVFDARGRPLGDAIDALSPDLYHRVWPSIVANADGGFTIAWYRTHSTDGWSFEVTARRFDAAGNALGDEFLLSSTSTAADGGSREIPQIASLANGGMVGVWASEVQDSGYWEIMARVFDADGAPLGPEFLVPLRNDGIQYSCTVEGLSDGRFVVSWVSDSADPSGLGVFARIFAADGTATGDDFRVGSTIVSEKDLPAVQALADGAFVVAWTSYDINGEINVYLRTFDATGKPLRPEQLVVAPAGVFKVVPQIDALDDGGFILTFYTVTPGYREADLWSQRYDAQGLPLLTELRGGKGDDLMDLGGDGGLQGAGGAGDDTYIVNAADDRVVERAGNGADTVLAKLSWTLGPDIEVLRLQQEAGSADGAGNGTANALYGNGWNNVLEGLGGSDLIDGGAGIDTASYAHAPRGVTVDLAVATAQGTGGAGRDTLLRVENLDGSTHGDVLRGDAQANEIDGGGGADVLDGRAGADTLHGGGSDTLRGGKGGDYYFVLATDVVVEQAGGGRDIVLAGSSFTLSADVEHLYLMGKGDAQGTGNAGANRIVGNAQANRLYGGAGADTLQGGDGADTLIGGAGADLLQGGAGADAFRFARAPSTANIDVVADFSAGDRIELDRDVFTGIGAGAAVDPGRLVLGTAALDADDRLIYDAGTGALYYDADGSGALAALQIARFGNSTHPSIAADDLRLVD